MNDLNNFIPYAKQYIDDEDIRAVAEVLKSDWLTTGPSVERFEQYLAARVGAGYAVAVSNGTAALHAAYFAAGVGPGDEVITSPITFAATANAALYLGARVVFADIAPGTMHIDPAQVESLVTPKTKVIAPVDMTGTPADLDPIMEIARQHNLVVVEDAAHALGATYKGRPAGSIADMTIFSFHPVKHITTGEGGAVAASDEKYRKKLTMFRGHGITKDHQMLSENHGPWYYEMQQLGYNYRITDIQCALGISQFNKLDMFLKKRRQIACLYNNAFGNEPGLMIPGQLWETDPAWHLYVLQLAGSKPDRRKVVERLLSMNIGTQVHYLPVYLHPYYRKLGYRPGLCPCAEEYYRRALSIPMYPGLSEQDVERIIEAMKAVLCIVGTRDKGGL